MGVKGLQKYIDENCHHVKQKVCIFDMANRHRRDFNLTPKLVVDTMSFIQSLYDKHGHLESFYGGQWIEFSHVIRNFVKKFTDEKIKLIFFFDGCTVQIKRREWVSRRLKNYRDIAKLFNHLKYKKALLDGVYYNRKPTGIGSLTRMAIKILCPEVEVRSTLNDGDAEIADYAQKQDDVFGILSNDSDFTIFDSKPHFSVKELNYNTMCTVMYNREDLAQHLSIEVEQLPLFACLMGNDFLSATDLKEFHQNIRHSQLRFSTYDGRCNQKSQMFKPLAEEISCLINHRCWKGKTFDEIEISDISQEICGDDSLKRNIFQGISMYTKFNLFVQASCEVGYRHVNCTNLSEVFDIYENKIYQSSEVLEDHEDNSFSAINLIYRPLRRRLYGIIFHDELYQNRKIAVQEWCAYYGNKMEQADSIYPVYIPELGISMKDLWCKSFSDKMRYFLTCMKTCLSEFEISSIQPKFVVLCCIINYLLTNFEKPLLKKFEVIAFIAQAVYIQDKGPQHICAIEDPDIDTRAIHVCSMFMKGVQEVMVTLGVCDYPISCENAMPWNYFDGKTFHKMYALAKAQVSFKDLFDKKESDVKLFKNLYNKATFGVEALLN